MTPPAPARDAAWPPHGPLIAPSLLAADFARLGEEADAVAAAGAGCRNIAGPLEARKKPRPDQPGYSIEEQEKRGRDKYAIPEDNFRTGPSGFNDRPGTVGR